MSSPQALNPMTMPLEGSHLIEASAGTGKTWTIAALYLRLVLGLNTPARLPSDILVMTFTRAATGELADRIRARLVDVAQALREGRAVGEGGGKSQAWLDDLLEQFPPGPEREAAISRLSLAAESMDEAAIHTIDAWCQRMLREHAFDTGCLFDEELQSQEGALLMEAAQDYWRQSVYPLRGDALEQVVAAFGDPVRLARQVQPLLARAEPAWGGDLATVLEQALHARAVERVRIKQAWPTDVQALADGIEIVRSRLPAAVGKCLGRPSDVRKWLGQLAIWAGDPASEHTGLSATALERLSAQGVRKALASQGLDAASLGLPPSPGSPADPVAPGDPADPADPADAADVANAADNADNAAALAAWAALEALDALPSRLAALPSPEVRLRQHAAWSIEARLQQIKSQSGRFGFADLLVRLNTALDEGVDPVRAQRLRQRILAQYPVALIDEFQDTSAVQLSIFDRLYRIADHDPATTLLLIGDPKQAIYRFRGADIHSYLQARRATEGRHHRLARNHRSTAEVVQVVNRLFERAEQRMQPTQGAPAEGGAFLMPELTFQPVEAQGRPERLLDGTGAVAALTLVLDPVPRNKEDSQHLCAALCAERIVGLLNDRQAGFEEQGKPRRALRPADMAVLVRDRHEARAVRRELQRRGMASVFLSDKDSVFLTPQATDVLRLLQAVAAPRDARKARTALATALLALPVAELRCLAQDETAFDRQAQLLQALHGVWQGQGVLTLLRAALHRFGMPVRWPQAQAERILTNVLHLAELLQAASAQQEGMGSLIRWLAEQIREAELGLAEGDAQVMRLESDADRIKVVTVHSSKGLEYPVVFLPFLSHFRGVKEGEVDPSGPGREDADRERLREDLRLLYVALTRARHALWVGLSGCVFGSRKEYGWHRSAVGCLVSGPVERDMAQRVIDVRDFAADPMLPPGSVHLEELPNSPTLPLPPVTPARQHAAATPLVPPQPYAGIVERGWSVSSYSGLVRDAQGGTPVLALPEPGLGAVPVMRVDDEPDAPPPAQQGPQSILEAWHRLPRGAAIGTFLHDQLEWLATEGFDLESSEALRQEVRRRAERHGFGQGADDMLQWLRRICSEPLPALGTSLRGLDRVLPEMEFWFPSDGLQVSQIDQLCRRHILPGQPRAALAPRVLKGMLMGFADLVFESQGRHGVLDYKSNALGANGESYTHAAMCRSVVEHRYDVQAAVYLLALHRLLKARLGEGHDAARTLGPALFFFVRGVDGPEAGCCALDVPLTLIESLDALLPPMQPPPMRPPLHGRAP